MTMTRTTVSIGISAFNEEQNIKELLDRLIEQRQDIYELTEILVVSDGSTDHTVEEVRKISDPRVRLVVFEENRGLTSAQNKIVSSISGDILVLLDADVLPENNDFINQIIKPLRLNPLVGMASADTVSVTPRNLFGEIVRFSHQLKQSIYKDINSGSNIYLCQGAARAFRRSFYEQLRWPQVNAEDSFSYMTCRQAGFKYVFTPAARVLFRSPQTFGDYSKQSNRFRMGKKQLEQRFSPQQVKDSLHIPLSTVLKKSMQYSLRHPLLMTGYAAVFVTTLFYKKWVRPVPLSKFERASTSKAVL